MPVSDELKRLCHRRLCLRLVEPEDADFIPCYKCREVKRTYICYTGASFVSFRNDPSSY